MTDTPIDINEPLNTFRDCHSGIVRLLREMRELPKLAEAAERARLLAAEAVSMFDGPVLEHHKDEERELFPAVMRSAQPGNEAAEISAMVQRLEREHRIVEGLWRKLESPIRDVAKGRHVVLDAEQVEELITIYLVHANFEEQYFLPMAEKILGRESRHMAALGMSMHMRHVKVPVTGYI